MAVEIVIDLVVELDLSQALLSRRGQFLVCHLNRLVLAIVIS